MKIRQVEKPVYIIDDSILKRYNNFNNVAHDIVRARSKNPDLRDCGKNKTAQGIRNIAENKPGYSRVEYAFYKATYTLQKILSPFESNMVNWDFPDMPGVVNKWEQLQRPEEDMPEKWYRENRYEVTDKAMMSQQVKRAAQVYGASLVGITEINPKWIYSYRMLEKPPFELPEDIKYAIILAVESDKYAMATTPEVPASAATGMGYSNMPRVALPLAQFIYNLGYSVIPAGNGLSLTIPLAIDAGLGQLGRNGLLVTPEYGPRVRLAAVFTNLPLEPDKPIDFGLTEFCMNCMRCAEECEVDAISKEKEPYWDVKCSSNNPGALKWYVDTEKCRIYWCENGADCNGCVKACPFSGIEKTLTAEEFWKSDAKK